MLVRKGYPDIGWNPVEGERYLDFLRFAVFCNGEHFYTKSPFLNWDYVTGQTCYFYQQCNVIVTKNTSTPLWPGESVEENANVVVRLLIRRPECFGPALRGEGGDGLLAAMEEAIKISKDLSRDGPSPTSESSKTL